VTRFSKTFKKRLYKEYSWLDYLEVRTLWLPDKELSINGFIDIVGPERELLGDDDDDELEPDGDKFTSHKDKDKYERRFESLLRLARVRIAKYGKNYPFTIVGGKSLKRVDSLNDGNFLYIYLLCCSLLSEFEDLNSKLTSDFESLSLEAIRKLTPSSSKLFISGRNALNNKEARYKGSLMTKLQRISKDLELDFKNRDYKPTATTSSGDGGVDIVGWVDFKDKSMNKLRILAQSKCSEKWLEGGSDAYSKLKGIFSFDPLPVNYYFIPFCFRNHAFGWNDRTPVNSMILIDRSRLFSLLSKNKITKFVNNSDSISLLKTLMAEEAEHIFE
jgi:hypothetical protein